MLDREFQKAITEAAMKSLDGDLRGGEYDFQAKPIRYPKAGNPWYPLHPDYPRLSKREQRDSRRNAIFLQETPEDVVNAVEILDRHYLIPGGFYKPPHFPSSPTHYSVIKDWVTYPLNIHALCRAFGKSLTMLKVIILLMISRQDFTISMIKSNIKYVRASFLKIKRQIKHNRLILADFGDLSHNGGSWSNEYIMLANGSNIMGFPVVSTQLGPRPDILFCDDAEVDPKMRVNPTLLTENFEELVVDQLIPQLDAGCAANVIGTLASRRLWIYRKAVATLEDDPKMAYWNRVIFPILIDGRSLWPAKFPLARLEKLRGIMGEAKFRSNFMNDPGTDESCLFHMHKLLSYYSVENQDAELETMPLASDAELVSYKPKIIVPSGLDVRCTEEEFNRKDDFTKLTRPYGKTVGNMFRAILVDPAKKKTSDSDFASIICVGREFSPEYKNVLWVLDLVLERMTQRETIEAVWKMGMKWQPNVIGVEAVTDLQHGLYESISTHFADHLEGKEWQPIVQDILYKGDTRLDKGMRIQNALEWRFANYTIKVPAHLQHLWPWSQLIFQIRNFTRDLKLLAKDDAIDSLTQFHYLPKPLFGRIIHPVDQDGQYDVIAALRRGELFYRDTKIPIITMLPKEEITTEVTDLYWAARSKYEQKQAKEQRMSRTAKFRQRRRKQWTNSHR